MAATGIPAIAPERIGQISVTVRHLDRAVGFYRDRLGLRFLFSAPKMGFFDCGGVRLMLSVPETPEFDHPSSIIYFDVPDIRAAFEALRGRGVEFRTEPHVVHRDGGRCLHMAFFRDSEGNTMALMSNEPESAPQPSSL